MPGILGYFLKFILLRNKVIYRHSTQPLLLELIFPINEKIKFLEKRNGFPYHPESADYPYPPS